MSLALNKPNLDNLAGDIWKSAERLRGKFKAYEPQKCTNGSWHGLKTPENTRTTDASSSFTQSSLKG